MVHAQCLAQILCATAAPLVWYHIAKGCPHDAPGGLVTGAVDYNNAWKGGVADVSIVGEWEQLKILHDLFEQHINVGIPVSCCMLKRCPISWAMVVETAGSGPKSRTRLTDKVVHIPSMYALPTT